MNSTNLEVSIISAIFIPHWHIATKIRISSFSLSWIVSVSTIAYHSFVFFSILPPILYGFYN
ncbi:MAG: hypothetical protein ACFFD5_14435 [Candidatus Thorarchaeota archaeon]